MIQIPILPKTVNELMRRHYREVTKEKNRVYEAVGFGVMNHTPNKPFKEAKLYLTRHSAVQPDWDGLVSSFKFVIDALIKYKIIENDGPDNIGQSQVHWEKAPRLKGFITISWIGIR